MKVRVPARVVESVLTSDAAARPETDELGAVLVEKLRAGRRYSDRSVGIDLTEDDYAVLREYASTLLESAEQDVKTPDTIADINASRACLRRLMQARVDSEVPS